jgi:hypothetical protein
MRVAATQMTPVRDGRLLAFRITGWALVLVLTIMGGVPGLLAPWTLIVAFPGHQFPEMHRWHDAQWGALQAILFAVPLVRLLLRPAERPLLLQFLLVATGALVLLNAPFDPLILLGFAFGFCGPVALLAYLSPNRHELRMLGVQPGERLNWALVTLSLLAGGLLARPAWRWYDMQLLGAGDEHSEFQHWAITAVLAFVLVGAGLLAATKRPGWVTLGIIAGVAFVYLGIAAIAVPGHAGSWGTRGGTLAILAGIAYVTATMLPTLRETTLRKALNLG